MIIMFIVLLQVSYPLGENDILEMWQSQNNKLSSSVTLYSGPGARSFNPPVVADSNLIFLNDKISSEAISTPRPEPPCQHQAEIERLANQINELHNELSRWPLRVADMMSQLSSYREGLAKANVRLAGKGQEVRHYKKQRDRVVKLYRHLQSRVKEAYKTHTFQLVADFGNIKDEDLARLAKIYWDIISCEPDSPEPVKLYFPPRLITDRAANTKPEVEPVAPSSIPSEESVGCDTGRSAESSPPSTQDSKLPIDFQSRPSSVHSEPPLLGWCPEENSESTTEDEATGHGTEASGSHGMTGEVASGSHSYSEHDTTSSVEPSSSETTTCTVEGSSSSALISSDRTDNTLRQASTSVTTLASGDASDALSRSNISLEEDTQSLATVASRKRAAFGCRCW